MNRSAQLFMMIVMVASCLATCVHRNFVASHSRLPVTTFSIILQNSPQWHLKFTVAFRILFHRRNNCSLFTAKFDKWHQHVAILSMHRISHNRWFSQFNCVVFDISLLIKRTHVELNHFCKILNILIPSQGCPCSARASLFTQLFNTFSAGLHSDIQHIKALNPKRS